MHNKEHKRDKTTNECKGIKYTHILPTTLHNLGAHLGSQN